MNLHYLLFLLFAFASPILSDKYEGDMLIFGFIPTRYYDFIVSLTKKDVDDLVDHKTKIFVDDASKVIDDIKKISPVAAEKAEKFHDDIYKQLEGLSHEAKQFVVDTMRDMTSVHDLKPHQAGCYRKCMKELLKKIKVAQKKPELMDEIGAVFHNIKDYWEDEKVKEFLEENLGKDPQKVVEFLEPDVPTPEKP
ncbi:hypothetical protein QR680_015574 [Steinernema hermaphroditum]|uniref:SXP/RAL-2 family protein Ani s 5-like cation-binding domain-containing protein n=1 Tax=Steinernema hermaphroditum TaxID=289476 RepID=A0AA39H982_9BILA|nr:hypothetical protein QR680_015574 [Steinernema hermaphroditum]